MFDFLSNIRSAFGGPVGRTQATPDHVWIEDVRRLMRHPEVEITDPKTIKEMKLAQGKNGKYYAHIPEKHLPCIQDLVVNGQVILSADEIEEWLDGHEEVFDVMFQTRLRLRSGGTGLLYKSRQASALVQAVPRMILWTREHEAIDPSIGSTNADDWYQFLLECLRRNYQYFEFTPVARMEADLREWRESMDLPELPQSKPRDRQGRVNNQAEPTEKAPIRTQIKQGVLIDVGETKDEIQDLKGQGLTDEEPTTAEQWQKAYFLMLQGTKTVKDFDHALATLTQGYEAGHLTQKQFEEAHEDLRQRRSIEQAKTTLEKISEDLLDLDKAYAAGAVREEEYNRCKAGLEMNAAILTAKQLWRDKTISAQECESKITAAQQKFAEAFPDHQEARQQPRPATAKRKVKA